MTDIPLIQIPCPLCGGTRTREVTSTVDYVYGIAGQYRFVRCRGCRHLYMNPRPSDESLMQCYPQTYAPHYDPASSAATSRDNDAIPGTPRTASTLRRLLARVPLLKRFLFWLGQQHATIVPPLPASQPRRLLEIGCAHGGYLQQAAALGWNVDGIEPDPQAAERACERGFVVQTTTLAQADLPEESREAIVAWMVLEHVPDPQQMVQHAQRVLTPGGTFCVSVPNAAGYERRLFGRFWLGYDAPRHLQVFTARRLRRLLQQLGFVEVKIIHQASLRYAWGSIAAWGMHTFPNARWPRRWMDAFVHEPPAWVRWAMLIPEKLVSLLRLSGRITVTARKPASSVVASRNPHPDARRLD